MKTFLQPLKVSSIKVLVLAACLSAAPQFAMGADNESVASAAPSDALKIVPSLGYTYFNIQGSSTDYKAKGGNSIAVLAQMPIMGGQVDLESGLEYLETGAKISADYGGMISITLMNLEMKQLTVPLRAKYIFNPTAEGTRWFGKAGITPTYLMSAKAETSGSSTDIKSNLNSFGLLTQVGLGADWGLDRIPGRISLDVTYNYGLTKVFKNEDGRAAGFQIQTGYIITL